MRITAILNPEAAEKTDHPYMINLSEAEFTIIANYGQSLINKHQTNNCNCLHCVMALASAALRKSFDSPIDVDVICIDTNVQRLNYKK